MRNYKLWNHWIAEVRDIAVAAKVYFQDEDFKNGKVRYATKTSIKYMFDKALMLDYFNDGLSPQEAFDEEVSTWDSY